MRVPACVWCIDGGERYSTHEDFPRGMQIWLILSIAGPQIPFATSRGHMGSLFSLFPLFNCPSSTLQKKGAYLTHPQPYYDVLSKM